MRSTRPRMAAVTLACMVLVVACSDGGAAPDDGTDPSSTSGPSTTIDGSDATSSTRAVPEADAIALGDERGVACAPHDDTGAPHEVDVWSMLNDDARDALNEAVLRFNRSHSDLAVRVTFEASRDKIVERLAGGERPDLVILGTDGVVNLLDSGIVTPAQRCIDHAPEFLDQDLLPTALPTYSRDGEVVAIPVAISTPILIYDKNTFAAAGLDPDAPPRTMDDLERAFRTLKESGLVTTGITYGEAAWFITQWSAQCGETILPGQNGRSVTADVTKVDLDGPCMRAALTRLAGWKESGLIERQDPNAKDNDDLVRLVTPDNRSGMAIHTSGSLGQVISTVESSIVDASVGVGPMPGPGTGSLIGGSGGYITADDPAAAWDAWRFLSFLADGPQQALFGRIGYAPLTGAALDDPDLKAAWADHPQLRVAYDSLHDLPVTDAMLTPVEGAQDHLFFRLKWAVEDVLDLRGLDVSLVDAAIDIDSMLVSYRDARQASTP